MSTKEWGWKRAGELEKIVQPGDIIEIKFGRGNFHYLFNIRRGWCVHVRTLEQTDGTNKDEDVPEVLKDATDLHQEAGSRPCRINNFEEFAEERKFTPRSLKRALTLSRLGLAQGPVRISASDIPQVCDRENFAKEFCIYWKYDTSSATQSSEFVQIRLIFLIFVIVVAAGAALMMAFL